MSAPPRQRRVLFLIADTGAGHRSAANAIHHAMRMLADSPELSSPRHPVSGPDGVEQRPGRPRENGGWHADIVDAFMECGRFPLRNGIFLYGPAIKHSPRLYGGFFHLTNSTARYQAATRYMKPFLYQGMAHLFLEKRPDVIVSVHPLLNHMSLDLLNELGIRIPFITVVTDLESIHCAWIDEHVTACVVPTKTAYHLALESGVPAKRVHLLGMPIDPKFAQPPAMSKAALRAHFGLDPDRPTVLLVGGGEGAKGLGAATSAVGESDLGVQMIVVTGRNRTLKAHLEQASREYRAPARILGFVDNMPDLMRAADVIVTKAGPGTINEAMACGLPIVLTGAIPGQEEGNIDFVLDNDIGMLARTPDAVIDALRELLAPQSPTLARLRENVRAMSRPDASLDIARLILKHLPPVESTSPWDKISHRNLPRRYRPRRGRAGAARRRPRLSLRGVRPGANWAILQAVRYRVDGQPRRIIPGLADLRGARALLLKGARLGGRQLRRPGRSSTGQLAD